MRARPGVDVLVPAAQVWIAAARVGRYRTRSPPCLAMSVPGEPKARPLGQDAGGGALAEPVPGRQVHALAEAAGCVRVPAGQPAAELADREQFGLHPVGAQ